MKQVKIHLIAAARPNFMKIGPLYHALRDEPWAEPFIVHTGQHYDVNMSEAFFKDLRLPEPDIHLGIGSGTHAEQTGKVMIAYEKVLVGTRPDVVIVVGDVNSTLACALAATKICYNEAARPPNFFARLTVRQASQPSSHYTHRPLLAHLEAGLRSFDRTMPEEINRIVTDALSNILWTPSPDADENLLKEGIPASRIERVGNIMMDSLEMMRNEIEKQNMLEQYSLHRGEYALVTLHRPSNVDDPICLKQICGSLRRISENIKIVFPVHPRTRKNLQSFGLDELLESNGRIIVTEPMSYVPFMNFVFNARFVLTDSGGLQEETTYLGIPCLTLRPNTERPITIEQGTNRLTTPEKLLDDAMGILGGSIAPYKVPEMWDGRTSTRVVNSIKAFLGKGLL